MTHPLTRIWEIDLRKMSAQCPGEEENPILICQQPVIRRSSLVGLSQKVRKLILNTSPGRLRYLSPVFLPNHRWKWPNYLHLGFPHLCNINSHCQQRPQIARGLKQNEERLNGAKLTLLPPNLISLVQSSTHIYMNPPSLPVACLSVFKHIAMCTVWTCILYTQSI